MRFATRGDTIDAVRIGKLTPAQVQLQWASLDKADLEGASFMDVFTWRADAREAHWKDTRVVNPEIGPKQACRVPEKSWLTSTCEWSAESLDKLKKIIAEGVPEIEELPDTPKKIEHIFFSEAMPPNVNVLVWIGVQLSKKSNGASIRQRRSKEQTK